MANRAHHINCGTLRPAAERLVGGRGKVFGRGHLVCHCLLVETKDSGLVLVDTGFGTADVAHPERFQRMFRWLGAPVFDGEETAVAHVRRLGYKPSDVRHIVMTHLDLDHSGGLEDFPKARVHVHALEHRAAMARKSSADRRRYLPAHFAHGPDFATYQDAGATWFGFAAVRPLEGLGDAFALVPLAGHTRGHSGVVVRKADGWLLHAGDMYYFQDELLAEPQCPIGLRVFQGVMQAQRSVRLGNLARLRQLAVEHGDEVEIFCAHDPADFHRQAKPSAKTATGGPTIVG